MWINAKEELPKKEGWYIVCINDFGIPQAVGLAYYEPTKEKWWSNRSDKYRAVDYWMPIPPIKTHPL